MARQLSRCFRCGSTEIQPRRSEEFVREGRYVVATPIEADVCAKCGERYLPGSTVKQLEQLRDRVRRSDLEGLTVTGELLEPLDEPTSGAPGG